MSRLPFRPGLLLTATCVVFYIAAAAQIRSGSGTALHVAVDAVAAPILAAVRGSAELVQGVAGAAEAIRTTSEEIEDLRRQVSELRKTAQLQAAELLSLRQAHRLLDAHPDLAERAVAARVRSRDLLATHTATLDRGRRDGIQRDSAVLAEHGVLGRVDRVWERSCRLQLLSHPAAAAAARVEGVAPEGLLTGGDRPTLTGLPPYTVVPEGAPVFTTGSEGIYPPGLLLGTTGAARTEGLFTHVPVRLAARGPETLMVLVLPAAEVMR